MANLQGKYEWKNAGNNKSAGTSWIIKCNTIMCTNLHERNHDLSARGSQLMARNHKMIVRNRKDYESPILMIFWEYRMA